ncbi:FAD-dependent oxidoreductase, partial [Rhizobium ruizarguesonis]
FFGPYNEFEGTGKEIGFPLLRYQGNSAYMRDTGDPATTEGGQIEEGERVVDRHDRQVFADHIRDQEPPEAGKDDDVVGHDR